MEMIFKGPDFFFDKRNRLFDKINTRYCFNAICIFNAHIVGCKGNINFPVVNNKFGINVRRNGIIQVSTCGQCQMDYLIVVGMITFNLRVDIHQTIQCTLSTLHDVARHGVPNAYKCVILGGLLR